MAENRTQQLSMVQSERNHQWLSVKKNDLLLAVKEALTLFENFNNHLSQMNLSETRHIINVDFLQAIQKIEQHLKIIKDKLDNVALLEDKIHEIKKYYEVIKNSHNPLLNNDAISPLELIKIELQQLAAALIIAKPVAQNSVAATNSAIDILDHDTSQKIVSFLDRQSIYRLNQVNKKWYVRTNQDAHWDLTETTFANRNDTQGRAKYFYNLFQQKINALSKLSAKELVKRAENNDEIFKIIAHSEQLITTILKDRNFSLFQKYITLYPDLINNFLIIIHKIKFPTFKSQYLEQDIVLLGMTQILKPSTNDVASYRSILLFFSLYENVCRHISTINQRWPNKISAEICENILNDKELWKYLQPTMINLIYYHVSHIYTLEEYVDKVLAIPHLYEKFHKLNVTYYFETAAKSNIDLLKKLLSKAKFVESYNQYYLTKIITDHDLQYFAQHTPVLATACFRKGVDLGLTTAEIEEVKTGIVQHHCHELLSQQNPQAMNVDNNNESDVVRITKLLSKHYKNAYELSAESLATVLQTPELLKLILDITFDDWDFYHQAMLEPVLMQQVLVNARDKNIFSQVMTSLILQERMILILRTTLTKILNDRDYPFTDHHMELVLTLFSNILNVTKDSNVALKLDCLRLLIKAIIPDKIEYFINRLFDDELKSSLNRISPSEILYILCTNGHSRSSQELFFQKFLESENTQKRSLQWLEMELNLLLYTNHMAEFLITYFPRIGELPKNKFNQIFEAYHQDQEDQANESTVANENKRSF